MSPDRDAREARLTAALLESTLRAQGHDAAHGRITAELVRTSSRARLARYVAGRAPATRTTVGGAR